MRKENDREETIAVGLFLSKFDRDGLAKLGLKTFKEAFNVLGYALNANPASIKNYRDEFDPFFNNPRKGWHKRPIRPYCDEVMQKYRGLDLTDFSRKLEIFLGQSFDDADATPDGESAHAKRNLTGQAAEQYFVSNYPKLKLFSGFLHRDTTQWGCGYDFQMTKPGLGRTIVVEVKGLSTLTGNLSLTEREYEAARHRRRDYILFVVKNFRDKPMHDMFPDPLSGPLNFRRREKHVLQVNWQSSV